MNVYCFHKLQEKIKVNKEGEVWLGPSRRLGLGAMCPPEGRTQAVEVQDTLSLNAWGSCPQYIPMIGEKMMFWLVNKR